MKGKGVFSGVKLSEQTSVQPPGVDQRLFMPTPSPATGPLVSTAETNRPTTPDSPPAGEIPPTTLYGPLKARTAPERPPAASLPATPLPEPPARFELDMSGLPHRKDSFLFTSEEFEALEDAKLAIGRALDVRVTKQNLVRCAVAYLIDDWRRKGANSPVIAPLKRRGR